MELHPKFLIKDGQRQFAVIPYEEFLALQEFLEEIEDLMALRAAKQKEADQPTVPLAEVQQMVEQP
ncbi:MAG: type II toxin-antitoxin system Phd/YefM family antitoxin [Cyanobacteria bacterium RM1_2_2]|nr:type II toxin-antitoxin system Phd/YefM family antitoxin [Cyanobacteria bacterium RM1_2_2]